MIDREKIQAAFRELARYTLETRHIVIPCTIRTHFIDLLLPLGGTSDVEIIKKVRTTMFFLLGNPEAILNKELVGMLIDILPREDNSSSSLGDSSMGHPDISEYVPFDTSSDVDTESIVETFNPYEDDSFEGEDSSEHNESNIRSIQ